MFSLTNSVQTFDIQSAKISEAINYFVPSEIKKNIYF